MRGGLETEKSLLFLTSTFPRPPLSISSKVEGAFGFWRPKGLLATEMPRPVLPTLKPRVVSS